MKVTHATIIVIAALTAQARSVDVTLWRGETTTRIVHDYARIGAAPNGFEVKVGTAHEVRYLTRPFGTHYERFADRVEWGSDEPGVKVLSVAVPEDAKPGEYRAGDVKITVIDRVLPPAKEWRYFLDLWQHPWAVARYFGVKPFSKEHYARMRPLWKMLAEAGQKTLTVTLLDKPWDNQCYDAYGTMIRHVRTRDGKWRFDYSVFDEYVEFGRECGLGPVISCYTMCPWGYVVAWEDEDGVAHKVKAVPGTAEFRDYWGDFLADFAAHLKDKGWFGDAVISIDERSPDDVRNIAALIAEKAPGLKIAIAGNRPPSQFEGIDIHHACFGLDHLTDRLISEAAERRKNGMVTTYYVCCEPDYPNTMCHNELEEAFWLGVYPAFAGLDGFLRWAWNSWPEDPVNDASYTGIATGWKAGDTYLVYPDGSPSLRFLELKNGIVAAEKIRILKEQGLFTDDIAALAEKFDRKAALSNKADFFSLKNAAIELVNKSEYTAATAVAARPIPRPALAARLAEGPEIIGIVHWGLNTYTDREWGFGDEDPAMLIPAKFDANQIVGACKAGGIGGLVVVAKHHDGFCLWPTKTTDYNITKTPFWRGTGNVEQGTGRDYLKEMEQACRRAGLKFGVYCSPWDRNNAHYGTVKYVTDVFQRQLRELLSGNYGEIFEMWFDGANGGDGYYGGAREKRKIPDGYYRYGTETFAMVRGLQPNVCIFNEMDEADFRFGGNEMGLVDSDSRSTIGHYDGVWDHYKLVANIGAADGTTFHPIEADFPLRKGWFYHESERGTTKSAAYLTKLYLSSVGNAATMNIGVAPNKDGLLDADDVKALSGFKTLKDALFAHEVKTGGAQSSATVGEPFNVIVMREDISKGEQVDEWEFVADGTAILRGKSIGIKRIRVLETPCAAKLCEVRVLKNGGAFQDVSFKLYRADPELVRLVLSATTESGETDTAKWMTAALFSPPTH